MKYINVTLLLIFIATGMQLANAYDFMVDGLCYNYNSDSISVMLTYENRYANLSGVLNIPESVNYSGKTYSVTRIDYEAFKNCTGLVSINIPNSITIICNDAFSGCSGLTSICVANDNPIYDSRNNSNAIIKTATNTLVCGCKNTIIPNSVTSIGNFAFSGCAGLTSLTIPYSVTLIAHRAFELCTGLISMTIPHSVKEIGSNAFFGCTSLKSINIPNSVIDIGSSAFSGCVSLTSMTIPNSLTSIAANTFYNCSNLNSINIANSVKTIGDEAFCGCSHLTSITIPSSVISIGNTVFRGCISLTTISIPSSVTTIGHSVFEDTPWYNNQQTGIVYAGLVAYKYKGIMPDDTSINLKDGCIGIASTAFSRCTGLTSIIIPNSVVSIGDQAFEFCTSLTSIAIPDSVTSIGFYTFHGCSGLTSFNIPSSVTSIGNAAFSGCTGLTSINIPNTVTSIGVSPFSGCNSLSSISVEKNNQNYDSRNNCNAIIETITNKLINGCKNTIIPNTVTTIGNAAFSGCTGLTSVTIPNSVTSIDAYAFLNCNGLKSISIPNSVTAIGSDAFIFCTGLNSITIPNSVISIGTNAFGFCSGLTSILSYIDDPNNIFLGNSVFLDIDKSNCTLTVPAASLGLYCSAEQWQDFLHILPDVFVSSISLNKTQLSILTNHTDTLKAIILPNNAYSGVNWSSSNINVVTVNENGIVTARNVGEAIVSASTKDGTFLCASCEVTVILACDFYPTTTEMSHIRGETSSVVIPFWMSNKTAISGLQFDITLPTGVSFAAVNDYPDVWLSPTRKARNHSVDVSLISGSKYRVLVSSPTNNTFKGNEGEVLYMRFNIDKVHPIGSYYINTNNVILVEPDETQHSISNKSVQINYKYLLGDADGDARVDVADYTVTALYILNRPTDVFYSDAANVSGDNGINVTDLVGITNISLGIRPHEYRPAPAVTMDNETQESMPSLNASMEGDNIVTLSIDNDTPLAGMQLDLQLPQGMVLADATLEGRAAEYQLGSNILADGSVRLLISSFGDKDIEAGNDAVIKLVLEGDNVNNEMLYITEAQAASRDLRSYELNDLTLPVGTTSIDDIGYSYDNLSIYGKGNTIVVNSPSAMLIQVVHVNGMVMPVEIKPGHNTIDVGGHGVYIIRVGNSAYKVRL